jgi:hypothetical protein
MTAERAGDSEDAWQNARFERKCVVEAEHYDWLACWVDERTLAFRRAFPGRVVQSLYFDSGSLDGLGDNLSGVGERQKIRLRWYGTSSAIERAALEVKCKRNQLGIKLSYPIELPAPLAQLSFGELTRSVSRQLPEDARSLVERASRTVVKTRYWREYRVSGDGRVRATIDRDIRVYDQSEYTRINDVRPVPFPDLVVLELKYDSSLDSEVRAALGPLPRRLARFSKYAVGVQAILGV